MFRKRNIWKSLGYGLLASNVIMVIIWMIESAFGYPPHYLLTFCITNAITILFWLFRVVLPEAGW
jgi:hypothetical protein